MLSHQAKPPISDSSQAEATGHMPNWFCLAWEGTVERSSMDTNWLWLLVRETSATCKPLLVTAHYYENPTKRPFRHGSSHPPSNHDTSTGFDLRPNADSWTSVPTAAVRVHSLAPASHLSPFMSLPQVKASHTRALRSGRPLRMSDLRLSAGLITGKVTFKKPYTAHFLLKFKTKQQIRQLFYVI